MKTYLCALCAAAFLLPGVVAADGNTQESTPIELSAAQMDQITAGSLGLPNGRVVQGSFDNPAPNKNGYLGELLGLCDTATGAFCHPALTRRSDTAFVTGDLTPNVTGDGNDGPWTATVVSHKIDFVP
jgi:hypothetical protein